MRPCNAAVHLPKRAELGHCLSSMSMHKSFLNRRVDGCLSKCPSRPLGSRGHSQCQATSGKAQFAGGSGTAEFVSTTDNPLIEAKPLHWLASWRAEANRLRSQLASYGVSGILAYGLLNTLYYSGAFLVIWLYFAKVPRGLGWSEVIKQFATVMGLTWAASQVTKIPRAAAALVLAPAADGLLIFVQARCRLRTRRNAFAFLVAACLLLAGIIFAMTLLFWA